MYVKFIFCIKILKINNHNTIIIIDSHKNLDMNKKWLLDLYETVQVKTHRETTHKKKAIRHSINNLYEKIIRENVPPKKSSVHV